MKKPIRAGRQRQSAFSLIEMLTAMTILSVLMLMMTSLLDQVQQSWRFGEDRISQFREARVAFDLVTKNMSQATMNTYWDYKYSDNNEIEKYIKRTELHFYAEQAARIEGKLGLSGQTSGHAIFFQAPLGYSLRYRNLSNLFNGRGYLVVHGNDDEFRPSFVTTDRYRFRLMEFRPPAEANEVFQDAIEELEGDTPQEQSFTKWWNQGLGIGNGNFIDHLNPMAENIVLLVSSPMDSLQSPNDDRYDLGKEIAPFYRFDSNDTPKEEHSQQVPPLMKVTMVAIDESTAIRLADKHGANKPDIIPSGLFERVEKYNDDVEELIQHFNDHNKKQTDKINYRVFSTVVMLRSSKWVD